MCKFRVGKTYKNKLGQDVLILKNDVTHPTHTVIGLLTREDGQQTPRQYSAEGVYYTDGFSAHDLALPKRTAYVNFYANGQAYWHSTEKRALDDASDICISAAIPVTIYGE